MKQEALIPAAIICAGIILAFTIYSLRHVTPTLENGNPSATRPISSTDHMLGNPLAPVVIIEYADIDSEYSKQFQKVLEKIADTYSTNGNVTWVYRHIPDDSDPNAQTNDEASECVAALGGTPAFFKFIDAVQTQSPGDSAFDPANYDSIVSGLGLASGTFDACMTAHTYQARVNDDYQNTISIGATGVPYSVLIVKGQDPRVLSGSLDYTSMKAIIDKSLNSVLSH
jgi:protein-disulfide isomerase